MASDLSPQSEQYLQQMVAGGIYPTKEAAIDAAVAALREKNEHLPFVPDEHMDLVEEGLASSDAGESRPLTSDDWARYRQAAYDAAARKQAGKQ